MPIIIKLKTHFSKVQLERDLRSNFIDVIVKRKGAGRIIVIDDSDIVVGFKIEKDSVEIYARTRIFPLLFAGSNIYSRGLLQDEKSESEKRYSDWFNDKYENYISS